ncbi:hypothetical protein ABPG75_001925 [Micractinium tetrahymenae]
MLPTACQFRCPAATGGHLQSRTTSLRTSAAAHPWPARRQHRRLPTAPRAAVETSTAGAPAAATGTQCIFQALGGAAAVEAAVNRFYERVLADPDVSHYFEGVDMKKQKAKQVAFMALAFGGADCYRGRDMRTAHQGLPGLSNRHFDAILGHFVDTLQELGVQQEVIDRAAAVVEGTRAQFDLADN